MASAGKVNGFQPAAASPEVDLGTIAGDSINVNWTLGGAQKVTLASSTYGGNVWATYTPQSVTRNSVSLVGDTSSTLCYGGWTGYGMADLWSGTSWSTTTSMPVTKVTGTGCGITSAALCLGGGTAYGSHSNSNYVWNGNSWASSTVMPGSRCYFASSGTTSEAICFGGYSTSQGNNTWKWSGGAWATTSVMKVYTYNHAAAGGGTTNSVLSMGNSTAGTVEIWDGSAWATTSSLSTKKTNPGAAGESSAAICFCGYNDFGGTATNEQWNGSSWSTTSSLNNIRQYGSGTGTITSALCAAGIGLPTEMWISMFSSTISFTNPDGAQRMTLRLVQSPSPYVQGVTLPIVWVGNSSPSRSRDKIDLLDLYFDGTDYFGEILTPLN